MQDSVRPDEIARFDALAASWWDPTGPMRPLHAMNPLRTGWIDTRMARHSLGDSVLSGKSEEGQGEHAGGASSTARSRRPTLVDLGCGAGLASESLARLGHTVLGVDAAADLIQAAQNHAAGQDLPLRYRHATAEILIAEGQTFQTVTALEIIEHVTDPSAFLCLLAQLVQPGGRLFISTLNRTARSLVVAKFGAEYIARLLPPGTHEWRRFITPSELMGYARRAGFKPTATIGMTYELRSRTWARSADLTINYMSEFKRA